MCSLSLPSLAPHTPHSSPSICHFATGPARRVCFYRAQTGAIQHIWTKVCTWSSFGAPQIQRMRQVEHCLACDVAPPPPRAKARVSSLCPQALGCTCSHVCACLTSLCTMWVDTHRLHAPYKHWYLRNAVSTLARSYCASGVSGWAEGRLLLQFLPQSASDSLNCSVASGVPKLQKRPLTRENWYPRTTAVPITAPVSLSSRSLRRTSVRALVLHGPISVRGAPSCASSSHSTCSPRLIDTSFEVKQAADAPVTKARWVTLSSRPAIRHSPTLRLRTAASTSSSPPTVYSILTWAGTPSRDGANLLIVSRTRWHHVQRIYTWHSYGQANAALH